MRCYHIQLLAMVVLLSGLEGCFRQVDQRPDEWASPEVRAALADCPNISGHYQDKASEGSGFGRLSVILFPESSIEYSSVKISQRGDDYLHVTRYASPGEIQIERTLSRDSGDFQCASEGLVLKESIGHFWVISAMYGRGTHILNRTEDKSLVVHTKGWVTAYHAFIPYSIRNVLWSRFEKYSTNDKAASIATNKEGAIEEHHKSPDDVKLIEPAETEMLEITAQAGDVEYQLQMYWNTLAPESLKWLCRAALQGNPEARYRLGFLCEHGKETVKDNVKAYQWYRLGGDVGGVWGGGAARKAAKRMARNLTSEQLAEGEQFIAEHLPDQCVIETVITPGNKRKNR